MGEMGASPLYRGEKTLQSEERQNPIEFGTRARLSGWRKEEFMRYLSEMLKKSKTCTMLMMDLAVMSEIGCQKK